VIRANQQIRPTFQLLFYTLEQLRCSILDWQPTLNTSVKNQFCLARHQRGCNLDQESIGACEPIAARFYFQPLAAERWHLVQGEILDAVNFVGFDSLMARLTANLHPAFVAVQVGFAFPS
jgi:hypothetical protein